MKISFLTTQSVIQSTVIGRVLPLSKAFVSMGHEVTLYVHREKDATEQISDIKGVNVTITGTQPFSRSASGKKRLRGFSLVWMMATNALRAAWKLILEQPDVLILVKPLPENTFAAWLAKLFIWNTKIVLDVDDFELFANKLSSLSQRALLHASERVATGMSSHIVVATPFLYDHIHQMVAGNKSVTLIPTGLDPIAMRSNHEVSHRMLYIGSLSGTSGHRVGMLPEILAKVRETIPYATLALSGSGDDTKVLQQQFETLRLTNAVTFLGRFTSKDVPRIISDSDILLDPIDASIVSRAKSSFRVALALVTGTPIVTSNIGIRTDLIPSEFHQRFFAKPQDATSYAERIVGLIQTPLSDKERSTMVEKSKEYTWEHLAKTYYSLLV